MRIIGKHHETLEDDILISQCYTYSSLTTFYVAHDLIIYRMRVPCVKRVWKWDIYHVFTGHLLNANRWQAP